MNRGHVPVIPIVDTSDFVWFIVLVSRVYHPSRFIRYQTTKIRPKNGDGKYRDMVKIRFIHCVMGIGLSMKTTTNQTKREVYRNATMQDQTSTLKRHAKPLKQQENASMRDCLPLDVVCDDFAKSLSLCLGKKEISHLIFRPKKL